MGQKVSGFVFILQRSTFISAQKHLQNFVFLTNNNPMLDNMHLGSLCITVLLEALVDAG